MPLTETGEKVLRDMRKKYGRKKGEQMFYATMRKNGMEDEQEENEDCGVKPEPVIHKKLRPIRMKKKD